MDQENFNVILLQVARCLSAGMLIALAGAFVAMVAGIARDVKNMRYRKQELIGLLLGAAAILLVALASAGCAFQDVSGNTIAVVPDKRIEQKEQFRGCAAAAFVAARQQGLVLTQEHVYWIRSNCLYVVEFIEELDQQDGGLPAEMLQSY